MESIKIFYRNCPEPDYKKFQSEDGIIIDVRSRSEYLSGHLSGAINVPLEVLSQKINVFTNKNQPLLLCCSTGIRSAAAKVFLESLGYTNVCNGGSWSYLQEKFIHYASI